MKPAGLPVALRALARSDHAAGPAVGRPTRTPSSPGEAELGAFVVAHALGASRATTRWTLACVALGAVGLALFFASPTAFERTLAALVVALALVGTALARTRGRRVLLVHAHGFAIADGDDEERGLGYAEVSRLYVSEAPLRLRVEAGARAPITLRAADPRGARVLRELVDRAVPVLLPRFSADLYGGEDCDFGALHLSRARLAVRVRGAVRELALGDVARVAVERGRLVIDADPASPRRFAELELGAVANLDVLERLLARVCPAAAASLAARPRRS